MLKKYFPAALMSTNSNAFIKAVVFYLVIGIVFGVICRVVGIIPIIGWLVAGIIGLVVGLYVLCGLVFSILIYVNSKK